MKHFGEKQRLWEITRVAALVAKRRRHRSPKPGLAGASPAKGMHVACRCKIFTEVRKLI